MNLNTYMIMMYTSNAIIINIHMIHTLIIMLSISEFGGLWKQNTRLQIQITIVKHALDLDLSKTAKDVSSISD